MENVRMKLKEHKNNIKSNMMVTIDSNEYSKHKNLGRLFEALPVLIDTEIKHLDVGDYKSGKCIIEHKSPKNFIQDILSGHIFQQCQDLKYSAMFGFQPYIFISGSIRDVLNCGVNISSKAIIASIASLNVRWGVPIIFCGNENLMVDMMYYFFEKSSDDKIPDINPVRKPVTTKNKVINNYMTLPDVDIVLAERLYQRFPIPEMLYNATTEELQEVERIGKKTADKIHEFSVGHRITTDETLDK